MEIQTIGIIEQVLESGQVRLEHSSKIRNEGKPDGLVTLTAIVDRADITTTVTPKGTRIYASPDADLNGGKSVETTADTRTQRLHMSGLKGVKLRTWTLSEEIGD